MEKQKILAPDGAAGDNFGNPVCLSGDTALIGSPNDDDNGVDAGSVYVFIFTGTNWTLQAKLLASDGAASDFFGYAVALDSDTALIGAYGDDDNGVDSGSAYVFTRTGTTWTQQAKLLASDGAAGDYFGCYSVTLDGDTALIGTQGDDNFKGSAYVFTRTGTTWAQQAKLTASDGAASDYFGFWVTLEGDNAIIGAHMDDNENGVDAGATYAFTRTGTTWTQQQKIIASDGPGGDWFGYSSFLAGDVAFITAPYDSDNGYHSGSTYEFIRTGGTWTQQAKILPSDGAANDWFGAQVSLGGDTVLIGAPGDSDNGPQSGSAYVFSRTKTTWTQQAKLLASDGAAGDYFGYYCVISLTGDTALIAAWLDDNENGVDAGSAYVFLRSADNQPPVAAFSWTPINPIPKQQITFDGSSSYDPDGNITLYEWDWNNDGVYDEAHSSPTTTHSWATAGSYPVTVRATDDDNATGTLTKTVYVNDTIDFSIKITGGFGIKANITNNGTIPATHIQWTFTLTKGFILLGKTKSGNIVSLAAGASRTVKDSPIIGFGKTIIRVNVTCAEGYTGTQSATGSMFLFFVFGIQES